MAHLNKAQLIGRFGKEPELKHTQSGKPFLNISVATTETYTKDGEKKEKTEWHNVVLWDKQAEFVAKYATKGGLVYVEGRLTYRTYEDKDGVTKYITEIQAREIQLLSSKPKDGVSKEEAHQEEVAAQGDGEDLPF